MMITFGKDKNIGNPCLATLIEWTVWPIYTGRKKAKERSDLYMCCLSLIYHDNLCK